MGIVCKFYGKSLACEILCSRFMSESCAYDLWR